MYNLSVELKLTVCFLDKHLKLFNKLFFGRVITRFHPKLLTHHVF